MNSQVKKAITILSDTILHRKTDCILPLNKTVYSILLCLVRAKKIDLLPCEPGSPHVIKQVKVIIKYHPLTQQALIRKIYTGSKPSRHAYVSIKDLKNCPSPQNLIVSTRHGILLASEALILGTGGTLLCGYIN